MSPKDTILRRRARFVAAALTSVGMVSCSSGPENPGPSVVDTGVVDGAKDSATTDSGPSDTPTPCLAPPFDSGTADTEPVVCLSAPLDTGTDAFDATVDAKDTGPLPCLAPPPG